MYLSGVTFNSMCFDVQYFILFLEVTLGDIMSGLPQKGPFTIIYYRAQFKKLHRLIPTINSSLDFILFVLRSGPTYILRYKAHCLYVTDRTVTFMSVCWGFLSYSEQQFISGCGQYWQEAGAAEILHYGTSFSLERCVSKLINRVFRLLFFGFFEIARHSSKQWIDILTNTVLVACSFDIRKCTPDVHNYIESCTAVSSSLVVFNYVQGASAHKHLDYKKERGGWWWCPLAADS